MYRILPMVVLGLALAGCSQYLDHVAAPFNSLVRAVIVDLDESMVKVEAGWAVNMEKVDARAEKGCLAAGKDKVPTLPISSGCAGIGCLTKVYVFGCYTKDEMKNLSKMLMEYVPDEYKKDGN